MKYQHPPSFRTFLIEMVKSFNINDRAAVSSWCRGLIPESKLDGKMATDTGMFYFNKESTICRRIIIY